MDTVERIKPEDKFVSVDGLKLRYIEEGSGPSVPSSFSTCNPP